MRKLTNEQIEAIQNQQTVYDNISLSDIDDDKKQEPTDYIRRYINAYRNKDSLSDGRGE